jgi:hypothetical protein
MGVDHWTLGLLERDEWLDSGGFFGSDSGSGSGIAPEPQPEPKPPQPHHVLWAIVAALCFAVVLMCAWLVRRTCCAESHREAALQTEYDVLQPAVYSSGSLQHGANAFAAENRGALDDLLRGRPSSLSAPLVKPTEKQALDDVTDVGW